MTREEAIKELEIELSMWESDCKSYHKTKDALKKAIELLKQEPFMNKPCVSAGVCEHDKIQVLDKVKAEINSLHNGCGLFNDGVDASLKVIDKYRTENKND